MDLCSKKATSDEERIPHHLLWSDRDPVPIGAGRGKRLASQIGTTRLPYKNLGRKTVGLLLCLAQPIHTSGRCVILDSGFCILKGLTIKLRKRGVFTSALIKKCRYWPRYSMDGNAINAHMGAVGKPLGAVDALPGQMDPPFLHKTKCATYSEKRVICEWVCMCAGWVPICCTRPI